MLRESEIGEAQGGNNQAQELHVGDPLEGPDRLLAFLIGQVVAVGGLGNDDVWGSSI